MMNLAYPPPGLVNSLVKYAKTLEINLRKAGEGGSPKMSVPQDNALHQTRRVGVPASRAVVGARFAGEAVFDGPRRRSGRWKEVRMSRGYKLVAIAMLSLAAAGPLGAQDTTCPPGSAWPKPTGGRPYDPRGPLVGEVVLKGIVKSKGAFSAMLEDCRFNKTLVVGAGALLVDGRITGIDATGVTFLVTGEPETPLPKPLTKRLTLKTEKR